MHEEGFEGELQSIRAMISRATRLMNEGEPGVSEATVLLDRAQKRLEDLIVALPEPASDANHLP